jgi:NAD(P)-dependent dehydrogenase (short-subunit alcohol dehydrogenase family)
MEIKNAVALVTGANRGLGLAFAQALLERGARKVYAAARDPRSISLAGVEPLQLDVTDQAQVDAAAAACGDVNLLINNAGIASATTFLAADGLDRARAELETNYFGPLRLSRAFAPALARNGGGAMINVLSIASWLNIGGLSTYAASKAAAWSLTNGLRYELHAQGTQVLGLHMGYVDTDMTRDIEAPKSSPDDIIRQALEALEAGQDEVLGDPFTRMVKAAMSAEPGVYLAATDASFQALLAERYA